jgi:hypothetical protein
MATRPASSSHRSMPSHWPTMCAVGLLGSSSDPLDSRSTSCHLAVPSRLFWPGRSNSSPL